VAL
ncbi:hypothetical protein S40293_01093, partial [Stachybotrys chartarum IBT 40293]|jgi:hypothetical protein